MPQRRNLGDWGVGIAAIVLASMIWLHAVTETPSRRQFDIPLLVERQVTDAAGTGQLVVSNSPPKTIHVLASGSGKDLLRVSGSDFVLRLRPSAANGPTTQSYSLTPGQVESHAAVSINIEQILTPTEVSLVLEPLVQREVPVRLALALVIAESYTQVGMPTIEPDHVLVDGPRSRVEALEAVWTDSLVRDQVRGDIDLRLALQADPDQMLTLNRSDVRVSIEVQELAEYPVPGVPVAVRNTGGKDVSVEPSRVQVKVRGGADVIGHLDPESDLDLYVDYQAWIRSGRKVATVQTPLNDLFEVQQIVPPEVTVIVPQPTSPQDQAKGAD
jgi:YbbR domain-containing protein